MQKVACEHRKYIKIRNGGASERPVPWTNLLKVGNVGIVTVVCKKLHGRIGKVEKIGIGDHQNGKVSLTNVLKVGEVELVTVACKKVGKNIGKIGIVERKNCQ